MPICTSCTTPVPYLYTLYATEYNLRLEQCPKCHEFADPYVEHDPFILVLDLILLKRDVFRHLIYNRGTEPRRLTDETQTEPQLGAAPVQDKVLWSQIGRIGLALLFVDSLIRWMRLYYSTNDSARSTPSAIRTFAHVFLYCLGETIAFHMGILIAATTLVPSARWIARKFKRGSNVQSSELRVPHIPLALLYASLTKFFLLFLLSVWPPGHPVSSSLNVPSYLTDYPFLAFVWNAFDDPILDREWVVRNLLGGMAAGFGLRVALDSHPLVITGAIVAGWGLTSAYVRLVDDILDWAPVGMASWTRYSIP